MCQCEQVKPTREPGPVTRCGVSRACPRITKKHLAEGCVMAAGGEGCPAFGSGCELGLLAGPWGSPGPVLAGSPIGMAGGTAGHRKTMLLLGNGDLLPCGLEGLFSTPGA